MKLLLIASLFFCSAASAHLAGHHHEHITDEVIEAPVVVEGETEADS